MGEDITINPIPQPRKNDAEDVSWALSTATAMWKRGDRTEAIRWLRNAVKAANTSLDDSRAIELAKLAADLEELPARPTAPPPPAASVPRMPPRPSALPRPAPSKVPPPTESRPGLWAESRRPPEPPLGRGLVRGVDNEVTAQIDVPQRPSHVVTPGETERPTMLTAGLTAGISSDSDVLDAWPTSSSSEPAAVTVVDQPLLALQRTPLRTSQAVRVLLWRDAQGVHISPAGTSVNAIGIEVLLVALDPATDLTSWIATTAGPH